MFKLISEVKLVVIIFFCNFYYYIKTIVSGNTEYALK